MSKFKVHLKLTGFELDIEGTRQDIPVIAHNIGQQLAGLIAPATGIVNGDVEEAQPRQPPATQYVEVVQPKRRKRRGSVPATAQAGETAKPANVLNWKHEAKKWSSPNQSWNTLNKALWLMYVAEQELQQSELSVRQIAETFNTHFKQSGAIRVPNVTRDLGNKKSGKEALVGENATVSPSRWYLTEAGKSHVTTLIAGKD